MGVYPRIVTGDAWSTLVDGVVFDDDPTEYDSAELDVDGWRGVQVLLDIESAGTPTTIRVLPKASDDDGVTWWDCETGMWAAMYFEDTEYASGGKKVFSLDVAGFDKVKFFLEAEGTDGGGNTFTVTLKARPYS